jgi:hypothetical protein
LTARKGGSLTPEAGGNPLRCRLRDLASPAASPACSARSSATARRDLPGTDDEQLERIVLVNLEEARAEVEAPEPHGT